LLVFEKSLAQYFPLLLPCIVRKLSNHTSSNEVLDGFIERKPLVNVFAVVNDKLSVQIAVSHEQPSVVGKPSSENLWEVTLFGKVFDHRVEWVLVRVLLHASQQSHVSKGGDVHAKERDPLLFVERLL
jgi:hypothetical protein